MTQFRLSDTKRRFYIFSRRPEDSRVAERMVSHLSPGAESVLCGGSSEFDGCHSDSEGVFIQIQSDIESVGVHVKAIIEAPGGRHEIDDTDSGIRDPRYDRQDWERRRNERIRRAVFNLIAAAVGVRAHLFWGILVGVRPTKIVHRLIDKGFTRSEIAEILRENYLLSCEKAELLLDVACLQRKYLLSPKAAEKTVSIYLGIPFCPTRCHYCSFAAFPMRTHAHLVNGFLQGLHREIREVGAVVRKLGLEVQTVYIGGGTPSSIGPERVGELLELFNREFDIEDGSEFTFEAGRPDTISKPLLENLKNNRVNRVSINPQTMNQKTLDIIGRAHSTDDVYRAAELTAAMDFDSVNMDIILGLPGEGKAEVDFTLSEISKLGPTNITVHTLAMKHAAKWRTNLELYSFPSDDEVVGMLDSARKTCTNLGMAPYYLYRQRFIAADLENVGYGLPGLESVYNIQMMEERQTVIGLGGGGVTKLIDPRTWELERHFNPKCPATFSGKYDELVKPKLDMIERFFGDLG